MNANLTRLQDLTHELRRQLKPLGRQAEVARRAQVIQTDVRDSRLRPFADDGSSGRRNSIVKRPTRRCCGLAAVNSTRNSRRLVAVKNRRAGNN